MSYFVTGTRERVYPADTSAHAGATEQRLGTMGPGWVPLTRERRPDGSLRVVYGRLPDETAEARPLDQRPVPAGRPIGTDIVRSIGTVIVVGAIIVIALAGITLLATPT
jgi:hypothetical protein